MKVFVTGSKGQLGREVYEIGANQGFQILGLDLPTFDITNPSSVRAEISGDKIDLVVNAAAYTAVDRAESEPLNVFAVNRDGPALLASTCASAGIPLIHVSTDYVFDGTKDAPYRETDTISPLGVYGKSKAQGEAEIRKRLAQHVIVRTAWLYGVHGSNFVKTMLRLGQERETLHVVDDQYGSPTSAADLAEAILKIAKQMQNKKEFPWGTYHYAGQGITTWHEFAESIFKYARNGYQGKVKEVVPIKAWEYPTPTKRPAYSVLDCSLLSQTFGIKPPFWKDSLEKVVDVLTSGRSEGRCA